MKFFQNRTLKFIGAAVLAGMFCILLTEYLIIRNRIEDLEATEERKDYARSIQLKGQQLAQLVDAHNTGAQNFASDILFRIRQQEISLKTLGQGGRPEGSEILLYPLSRLPKITYDNLLLDWHAYSQSITETLSGTANLMDSTSIALPASTLHTAKWLTVSDWFERLMTDLTEEAESKKNFVENLVLVFILFDILLLGALYYVFYRAVITPLHKLKFSTNQHIQDDTLPENEIGFLSKEINVIIEQLKDATEFVGAIGEGKLDFNYQSLDAHYTAGANKLADSLIQMQDKLKQMNEEEQRRKWANEGLTQFVDILRSSNDNIQILSDKIISSLVHYTKSNQGGLYLLNDEDEHNKHLELVSLFAFNIKKFEKQKLKLGEGILGQTFLEKQTTLLKEIPEDYIRITSGLGDANPKSILMVPLKVDTQVYGIVELASFNDYYDHEIAFVERLAETIASTLATVKSAQRNKNLIEQFQQQTEEMRAQEEEMRQNMEELQATQEEMARKERDYVNKINSLEAEMQQASQTIATLEKSTEGLTAQIKQSLERIEVLQSESSTPSNDWSVVEEVEKMFRVQLENLKITKEGLDNK